MSGKYCNFSFVRIYSNQKNQAENWLPRYEGTKVSQRLMTVNIIDLIIFLSLEPMWRLNFQFLIYFRNKKKKNKGLTAQN